MFKTKSVAHRLKVVLLLAALTVGVSLVPASSAGGPAISMKSQEQINPADKVTATELSVDDGSFETAIGLTFGGTLGAVNRLTPPSYPATLTDVRIFFRQGVGIGPGHAITILTNGNPDGGDDVSFLVYATMSATVNAVGEYNSYDVPDITINSGDFVVGFGITHSINSFPIALDSSTPFSHRSYVATAGVPYRHIEAANLVLIGNFGIRARVNLTQTCAFTFTPPSRGFETSGGSSSFDVTSSLDDCVWNATTAANWITITSGSGTGNGRVSYTVAANSGAERSANINVGSQVFPVTQMGFPVPVITNVLVQGKQLLVFGQRFDSGAQVFQDGSRLKKVSNDEDNPTTLLVAKKAGKAIDHGATVVLQVHNASGAVSPDFRFTRP